MATDFQLTSLSTNVPSIPNVGELFAPDYDDDVRDTLARIEDKIDRLQALVVEIFAGYRLVDGAFIDIQKLIK